MNNKLNALVTLILGLTAISCAAALTVHHPRAAGSDAQLVVTRVISLHPSVFTSIKAVTNLGTHDNVLAVSDTHGQRCWSTDLEQGGPGEVVRCEWR